MRLKTIIGLIVLAMAAHVCAAQTQAPVDQTVTTLVQQVQDAGAGALAGVSSSAMYLWMSVHHDVATATAQQCASIMPTAPAIWFDSLEGMMCWSAKQAAALPTPTVSVAARGQKVALVQFRWGKIWVIEREEDVQP